MNFLVMSMATDHIGTMLMNCDPAFSISKFMKMATISWLASHVDE